jgi:hypothetical protein
MLKIICAFTTAICVLTSWTGVAQRSTVPLVAERAAADETVRARLDEGYFDPSRRKALAYHDANIVISLLNGNKNLAVGIEDKAGQNSGKIDLPSEIVQVNEIRAVQKNKAVVVGMVNGSVFEVAILDTRSITIADSFLAYAPSVSPDGRFIAFVKFYPAHFVDGTDDHYLLYDLSRSARENRLAGGDVSDHTDVGTPSWPKTANRPGDNTGIPPLQQHHMTAQAFFWRSDSERYAFADDHAGDLDLVVVSPSQGVSDASKVRIPRGEICATLRSESCQVTLSSAELTQTGVIATFHGVGADSSLQQIFQYRYEQLSPVR